MISHINGRIQIFVYVNELTKKALFCYVHNMNNSSDLEEHKTLQILSELSDNGSTTQRNLSNRLGIALGLVNSYIKNLISKGYIKVKAIPPRRYSYYLTPKGFSEKTRLTYHLLQNYTRLYLQARNNLKKLFSDLQVSGVQRVVFAGADEVAEIAYLTLQETDMELAGVVDEEKAGKLFFGREILPLKDISSMTHDSVIITSYVQRDILFKELLKNNVERKDIKTIFPV
jgi:DNA-binding MarR family transcriptional regulator